MSDIPDLIESTKDLIAFRGQDIALTASVGTRTNAGGVSRRPGEPRNPVRRYFAAVAADARRLVTFEGERLEIRHVLIGMPGDDIRENDTFSIGNRKFQVVEVDPNETFQKKGWVVERG